MNSHIAFFDIDGVCFKSPGKATIEGNAEFWLDFWSKPESAVPNPEIRVLLNALRSAGVHIVFLTGRDFQFAEVTRQALVRTEIAHLVQPYAWMGGSAPPLPVNHDLLIMFHLEWLHQRITAQVGDFKLEVIRSFVALGHNVLFMVEDHKPAADVIRSSVPVLLYEAQRPTPIV